MLLLLFKLQSVSRWEISGFASGRILNKHMLSKSLLIIPICHWRHVSKYSLCFVLVQNDFFWYKLVLPFHSITKKKKVYPKNSYSKSNPLMLKVDNTDVIHPSRDIKVNAKTVTIKTTRVRYCYSMPNQYW